MELRRSAEDYLEAIYVLKHTKGVVRSIDVAHHLDYSKPSVSRAVNNLRAEGYLEMREGGELVLTSLGEETARNVYERHTILTELFAYVGVPRQLAAEDACRVEHAISPQTFACLKIAHRDYVAGKAGISAEAPAAQPAKKAEDKKAVDKADKKKKKKKK